MLMQTVETFKEHALHARLRPSQATQCARAQSHAPANALYLPGFGAPGSCQVEGGAALVIPRVHRRPACPAQQRHHLA